MILSCSMKVAHTRQTNLLPSLHILDEMTEQIHSSVPCFLVNKTRTLAYTELSEVYMALICPNAGSSRSIPGFSAATTLS